MIDYEQGSYISPGWSCGTEAISWPKSARQCMIRQSDILFKMVSPSAPKPGFQFITSINTIARNDETRRRVRSHARRQKLPSHTSTPQPRRQPTQKERISKFRLSSGTSSGSRKKRSTSASEEGCSVRSYDLERSPRWETTMISKDLAITVAKELPNFSLLRIETTPLTENLLKYCMTVCLSPQEKFVQKWFDRAGAPTYMNTRKATPTFIGTKAIHIPKMPNREQTDHSSFLSTTFAMNPSGDWMSSVRLAYL